jgi:hypothetical protein
MPLAEQGSRMLPEITKAGGPPPDGLAAAPRLACIGLFVETISIGEKRKEGS